MNGINSTSNYVDEPRRLRAEPSRCALGCPRVAAAMTTLANVITLNNLSRFLVSVMIINPVKSIYNVTIGIGNLIIGIPLFNRNASLLIKRINDFLRTTNVTVQDLDTAKSLLKRHRLSGNFSLPEKIPPGSDPNDLIFTCSKEHTKKLRSVYQHLFGNAQSRDKIRHILQKVIGELTSFSFHDLNQWLEALTKKIAANILFGIEPNAWINALDLRNSTQSEDLLRLSQTFFELLQNSPNAEFLQWMKQQGLSDSQIGQSLFTLFAIIQGNLSQGLRTLVQATQLNQQHYYRDDPCLGIRDAVSIDLRSLIHDGHSLWEAANASELIDSVCVESLRHSPVVREVLRSERIGSGRTRIHHVSIQALATANSGDRANRFCPMRYFGENKKHWPSHDFLPFGYGRHECPAWWLYKQTAVYFLAALCMRFTDQSDRMIRNDEQL